MNESTYGYKSTGNRPRSGRRLNANAYPLRAIVEAYYDPTRKGFIMLEKLECGHVMLRPYDNLTGIQRESKTGRRRCRECYQEGRS